MPGNALRALFIDPYFCPLSFMFIRNVKAKVKDGWKGSLYYSLLIDYSMNCCYQLRTGWCLSFVNSLQDSIVHASMFSKNWWFWRFDPGNWHAISRESCHNGWIFLEFGIRSRFLCFGSNYGGPTKELGATDTIVESSKRVGWIHHSPECRE